MISRLKTHVIKTVYNNLLKPIFFLADPERVHETIIGFGHFLGRYRVTKSIVRRLFYYEHPSLRQTVAGVDFANPVGLAAGFDKNAELINIIGDVGFGACELGTITAKPYRGNPKPRLRRLPASRALVVNYGLKNEGVAKILPKIKKPNPPHLKIGISIGKTNSPGTAAVSAGIEDYFDCFYKTVKSGKGDFYTINISCPNSFGGEPFTTPDNLTQLLDKLLMIKINKPMFLKMPINLGWRDFEGLLDVAIDFDITGIIIGNLNKNSKVKGGISGKPTWRLSNELISRTYRKYHKQLVIIGCGGIFSAEDAYEKIRRGASLVQLVTGLIYEGPQLIGDINRQLVLFLKRDEYTSIKQAVGAYHKRLIDK